MGSDIGLFGYLLDHLILVIGAIISGVIGLFLILRELNKDYQWVKRFEEWLTRSKSNDT